MAFNKKIIKDSILGLLLGGSIVYLSYICMSKTILMKILPNDSLTENVIFFTSIMFAPFVAIILHELGHLLAGLYQGFRLELFVVGFLGIKRENEKVKVYFNTNIQYFGGVAATSPIKIMTDEVLIRKYRIILLSGPSLSFVFGLIALLILYYFDSALNPFFGLLSITSFGIFLATTIPNKSGIFFTDRKRYQRLMDKGEIGKIELAFLQIVNQSLTENTYKNLPIERIQKLKTDQDKIIQFWGYYFEYQYFIDNNNIPLAETVKQTLLNYKIIIPSAIWKSLLID
ncbi:M50 family metallopeptidase [Flavobacterium sp. N1719]|uniref:M50 family metallopeptidase n=1 Tax=Flavobacterium sp. N1719 TaxID=2885633 RepID=UPI0022235951|nr:M50 family metallopeptidase [Flavobacterium sp. N1719]